MQKKKVITRICPECYEENIKDDLIHQEQYCYNCGLILQAPYNPEIVTSGYAIQITTYVQLINTPVLVNRKILTPEQLEQLQLRKLANKYPPVTEESKA